jgi:hypothetical protein
MDASSLLRAAAPPDFKTSASRIRSALDVQPSMLTLTGAATEAPPAVFNEALAVYASGPDCALAAVPSTHHAMASHPALREVRVTMFRPRCGVAIGCTSGFAGRIAPQWLT